MGLNHHFDSYDLSQDRSQVRPKFDWPALRKAIAFYESERLCTLPAYWGHKEPYVKWEEFQTRLPTMAEKADWFHAETTEVGVIDEADLEAIALDQVEEVAWHGEPEANQELS